MYKQLKKVNKLELELVEDEIGRRGPREYK